MAEPLVWPVGNEHVDVKLFGPAKYPMVRIPEGTFTMGAHDETPNRFDNERPAHRITLSGFWMGVAPVTQAQYAAFLAAEPDRGPLACAQHGQVVNHVSGPDRPMVCVTWEHARAFCRWSGLVLPTEAQWEYACRAGTETVYWSGDTEADLARVGWYGGNSLSGTQPVGQKPPNPFGLHDMHGNVWEWCEDWFDERAYDRPVRPGDGLRDIPPAAAHVIRGGAWCYSARVAAASVRTYNGIPEAPFFGFRGVTPPGGVLPP
jgi:formylglycine-generating enzyme required for sulfatase activity